MHGMSLSGNGVAGDTGNSYWYPTTSPDGGVVPNGSYVARCDWGYNIDTRLISPVISVQPDANVIFNWYSVLLERELTPMPS